jgi:predicted nucleic acid-binding Zn ribbon protein
MQSKPRPRKTAPVYPYNCPPSITDIQAMIDAALADSETRCVERMAEHERMAVGLSLVGTAAVLALGVAFGMGLG